MTGFHDNQTLTKHEHLRFQMLFLACLTIIYNSFVQFWSAISILPDICKRLCFFYIKHLKLVSA